MKHVILDMLSTNYMYFLILYTEQEVVHKSLGRAHKANKCMAAIIKLSVS